MDGDGRRLAQHLLEAERHVSEGERLVEHQRRTVEKRRRDGHHTELALQLLEEMEESLRLHIQDRDRLRREWTGNARLGGLQGESAAPAAERS
jgi:phytoene dehydrogenase-like protein